MEGSLLPKGSFCTKVKIKQNFIKLKKRQNNELPTWGKGNSNSKIKKLNTFNKIITKNKQEKKRQTKGKG